MKMHQKPALYLLLFSILFFFIGSYTTASAPALTLAPSHAHYLEVTGNDSSSFLWSITPLPDGNVLVVMESSGDRFENICQKTGETLEWRYQDGDSTMLVAKRSNNQITIQGTRLGNPVDTVIDIDERPWYQPLSFSLREFLDTERQQTSFWTIRVDTLEVHQLKAEKKGEDTISTIAGPVVAERVELRLQGMLARFWHADYWYRQQDRLFLRYSSVHGPFGTSATEVTIISASQEASGS